MTTRTLASCWTPPGAPATAVQHQAHEHLMHLLDSIRDRVPDILEHPERSTRSRILDSALAAMAAWPESLADFRGPVFDLLDDRLPHARKPSEKRLILPRTDTRNPVSETFPMLLSLRDAVLADIEGRLREPTFRAGSFSQESLLAITFIRIILQLGHCSRRLLAALLERMGSPLRVAMPWIYLDIALPETTQAAAEHRRVYFDPITAGFWARLQPRLSNDLPDRPSDRRQTLLTELDRAIRAVVSKESTTEGRVTLSLLCETAEQYLRINALPLLATYAAGDLPSSSLTEDTWLRLAGFAPPAVPDPAEGPVDEREAGTELPGDDGSVVEQIEIGNADASGLLADLRAVFQLPRSSWIKEIEALIVRCGDPESAEGLILRWVAELTRPRLTSDHRLADGTIRHYVSLIASRVLSVMVTPIREFDGEDLEQAYLDIAALAVSAQQRGRIVHVLRDFDRFVRKHCITDLPQARLPGFGSDRYAISARVVSFAEYQAAFDLLGRPEIAIASDHLRCQSRAFLTLAFRGGLRRGEILGLTVDDLRLTDRPIIQLRDNRIRRLKTSNGERKVPLGHLTDTELGCLRELLPAAAPEGQPLFFDDTPTVRELDNHPVVPIINRVLARTTGDTALHPHNLRHGLATTITLGVLGPDVGMDSHPWVQPWMINCVEPAQQIHPLISGALHRRAGRLSALSMMVGHGSERTTCEHYIHCLDLLHFFAATRDLMSNDVPMTPSSRAWLTAAAGYSGTTKISERTWEQASRLFVRAYQGRIEQCTPTAIGSAPVRIRSEQISLESLLMESPDGAGGIDLPKSQVWRDSASGFINTVNLWLDQDAVAATRMIGLLVRHRLKDSHWSSVKLDTLKEIVKLARILGIPLTSFDIKLVTTPPGSRVRKKSATTLAQAKRARNDAGIKYWLLIRDLRRGSTAKRSDMQSHVTWVLMRSWRRLVPVSH